MSDYLYGSICLSDIPKSEIRKVVCRDGSVKMYLNVFIGQSVHPRDFGGTKYTHYVSCSPKKESRVEGVNYYIGNLCSGRSVTSSSYIPTGDEISQSPSLSPEDDLPF